MKKCLLSIAIILAAFIFYLPAASANSGLQVDYRFGVDNRISTSQTIPVHVTITNNGEPFKGDFVFDSVELYAGGSGVVKPFEVANGETVELQFYVHGIADYIDKAMIEKRTHIFEQSVENGKKVDFTLTNFKAPNVVPFNTKRFLLLSNENAVLETIDSYTNTALRTAELTVIQPAMLTTTLKDYALYDVVYIDSTFAAQLASEQIDMLTQWARQGGTLLLAGDMKNTTFPTLLTFNNGKVTIENSSKKPTTLTNGTIVAEMDYRNGRIIHAQNGFEDTSFAKDPLVESILAEAITAKAPTDESMQQPYAASDWSYQNTYFDTFHYNKALILLFLLVYIAIVGPLLYVFLKKKDKREKMWLYIPLVAVVTSILMFVFGASDRLMKPQAQKLELVQLNGVGDAIVDSSYSFVSNKRGDYNMTTTSEASIAAYVDTLTTEDEISKKALLYTEDAGQRLQLRDVPYWSVQGAVTTEFAEDIGQFNSELKLANNILSGTIRNELPTDVERLIFVSGRNIVELGNLQANAAIDIHENVGFNVVTKPFSRDEYTVDTKYAGLSDQQKMYEQKIDNVIRTLMYNASDNRPMLIAISKDAFSSVQLVGDHSSTAITVIAQPVNVQVTFNGSFNIHSTDFDAAFLEDEMNSFANAYNENGKLKGSLYEGQYLLTYKLAKGILPKTTTWKELELKHKKSELQIEIYNFKTKQFEDITDATFTITEHVEHYMKDDEIHVKMRTTEEHYGALLDMPTFTLKGEAKQ